MLRWLTILATLGMIAVNGLANALPINGRATGEISDGFDILFTPAGYVFSIWGLIYLGLVGFAIVQALPSRHDDAIFAAVRPWFLLNTAANASWIFAWHYELFPLTLGLMLVILASLVAIYAKLEATARGDGLEFVFARAPFSVYFGWISIATIANTTVVLWELGLRGPLGDPTWTLAILVAATALCAVVSLRSGDPIYAAVFVWALIGIAVENSDRTLLLVGASSLAGVCAVVGGVSRFAVGRRSERRRSSTRS